MPSTSVFPFVLLALHTLHDTLQCCSHTHIFLQPIYYPCVHYAHTTEKIEHVSHFSSFHLSASPTANLYAYSASPLQVPRQASRWPKHTIDSPPCTHLLSKRSPQTRWNFSHSASHHLLSTPTAYLWAHLSHLHRILHRASHSCILTSTQPEYPSIWLWRMHYEQDETLQSLRTSPLPPIANIKLACKLS